MSGEGAAGSAWLEIGAGVHAPAGEGRAATNKGRAAGARVRAAADKGHTTNVTGSRREHRRSTTNESRADTMANRSRMGSSSNEYKSFP